MFSYQRRTGAAEAALAGKLEVLASRLDTLTALLERHCVVTMEHGQTLQGLPAAVVVKAIAEARAVAQTALAAALLTVRRRIIEELSKWAWRGVLGFLGLKALEYLHTLASGLQVPGTHP